MKKIITLAIIGIVVVGGIAFYGGMQYGKSSVQTSGTNGQFSRGTNFQGGTRNGSARTNGGSQMRGGGMISGEVLSRDLTSITIKLADGGSRNIFLSSSTKVTKSIAGTIDDVVTGSQILGQGTTNSDGSISAQTIQLR
jgi:hypothetical protein